MSVVKVKKKEYQVKDIDMDLRCVVVDEALKAVSEPNLTSYVKVIRSATDVSDDEMLEMTTNDIFELGQKVVGVFTQGKKKGKSK